MRGVQLSDYLCCPQLCLEESVAQTVLTRTKRPLDVSARAELRYRPLQTQLLRVELAQLALPVFLRSKGVVVLANMLSLWNWANLWGGVAKIGTGEKRGKACLKLVG